MVGPPVGPLTDPGPCFLSGTLPGFVLKFGFCLGLGWKTLSWKRRFDDPIVLPDGRKLVTLLDAATYATKLPKKEASRRIASRDLTQCDLY